MLLLGGVLLVLVLMVLLLRLGFAVALIMALDGGWVGLFQGGV